MKIKTRTAEPKTIARFPSKSSPGNYHKVKQHPDLKITCTCISFCVRNTCRHVEGVAEAKGLKVKPKAKAK